MADSKLTGLTANTTPALTDLIYLVDDPVGTPLSQKITVANLLSVAKLFVGTNVLELRNGATGQNFNIFNTWTDASNNAFLEVGFTGNVAGIRSKKVGSATQRELALSGLQVWFAAGANTTDYRWSIETTALLAWADNTYDIGASAAGRPRNIFVGTRVTAPAYTVGATAGASFGPAAVASITVVNGIVTAIS